MTNKANSLSQSSIDEKTHSTRLIFLIRIFLKNHHLIN